MFNKDLYPTVKRLNSGEKNSLVSLHIRCSKATKEINLGKYNDFYIARMEWTNDANVLSAQVLNRHQIIWIYCLLMERLERQK
jgi:dipeptidyl-peptidase-4